MESQLRWTRIQTIAESVPVSGIALGVLPGAIDFAAFRLSRVDDEWGQIDV